MKIIILFDVYYANVFSVVCNYAFFIYLTRSKLLNEKFATDMTLENVMIYFHAISTLACCQFRQFDC